MQEEKMRCRLYDQEGRLSRTLFKCLLTILFLNLSLFGFNTGHAAQVTLSWNPSSSDIEGYKVSYGTSSGSYSNTVNTGLMTSCILDGLRDGQTYYFAAKAYNGTLESGYSNEVGYTTPAPAPTPTYAITTQLSGSGSLTTTCSLLSSIPSGSTCTFKMVPASGSKILGVIVDGTRVGSPASYTFANITANHSIKVRFK